MPPQIKQDLNRSGWETTGELMSNALVNHALLADQSFIIRLPISLRKLPPRQSICPDAQIGPWCRMQNMHPSIHSLQLEAR